MFGCVCVVVCVWVFSVFVCFVWNLSCDVVWCGYLWGAVFVGVLSMLMASCVVCGVLRDVAWFVFCVCLNVLASAIMCLCVLVVICCVVLYNSFWGVFVCACVCVRVCFVSMRLWMLLVMHFVLLCGLGAVFCALVGVWAWVCNNCVYVRVVRL